MIPFYDHLADPCEKDFVLILRVLKGKETYKARKQSLDSFPSKEMRQRKLLHLPQED